MILTDEIIELTPEQGVAIETMIVKDGYPRFTEITAPLTREELELGTAALLNAGVVGGDLMEAATAIAARSILELGTAALEPLDTFLPTIRDITTVDTPTSTYALEMKDARKVLGSISTSPVEFLIGTELALSYTIGTTFIVEQYGPGVVTITVDPLVWLNNAGGASITLQRHQSAMFRYFGSDNWVGVVLGASTNSSGGAITEIFLTAAGGWPSTANGCAVNEKKQYATNGVNIWSLDFDDAAIEYAEWTVWMPDDWDGGTLTFKAVWAAASGTGDVRWGLQGRSFADNEALDAAWGTGVVVVDTLQNAARAHITALSGVVTLAGTPAGGELVQLRIYRHATDVGDTLAVDAQLLGVKLYYEVV